MISERVFTSQVIRLAQFYRWRVAHFRSAWTNKGYRTPVQGDGKGFFDLVLVRDYVIFAELKSDVGKLEPEQEKWANLVSAIAEARPGIACYVWRPKDYDSIMEILK